MFKLFLFGLTAIIGIIIILLINNFLRDFIYLFDE